MFSHNDFNCCIVKRHSVLFECIIYHVIQILFVNMDIALELCLYLNVLVMMKTWHISFSAGDEVLCRDEDDFNYLFNCIALAIAKNDATLLADSEMSTHFHKCIRAESPLAVFHDARYAYSRRFNRKYSRKGRFGEPRPYVIELEGRYHVMSAMLYVLRNALHHGVCATPFGYPHNSSRCVFRKELGFDLNDAIKVDRNIHRLMPAHVEVPAGYTMTESGLILRESVVDVADVEHIFGTPRSYLYHMNRLSGEEWIKEQSEDKHGSSPITLKIIEEGMPYHSVHELRANEYGVSNYKALTYTEACSIIQDRIISKYSKNSVYLLSRAEANETANWLYTTWRLSRKMISRCLALDYDRR